jgi:SnoaL-like domain
MDALAALSLRVARLEEIELIKELRRYHFPMSGDPETDVEAFLRLFTEDGMVEYPGGFGAAQGHDQLRAWLERDPVNARFHCFIPGWVRVNDDLTTGTGRWFLIETAKAHNPKTGRNEPIWVEAVYDDEYVKVDGQWKFKKYSCDLRMFCTHQAGWGERALDIESFFA